MASEVQRSPHYPIWFVVTARDTMPPLSMYGLRHILRVDAGDMADMDSYWERVVRPLQVENPTVEYQFYAREPENPFRATAEAAQEGGGDGG